MSDIKLTYFNVKGRAEICRLIFAKSGTPFEDDRIEFADWPARKSSMPMGQLPVLHYKGQDMIQSQTIARFLARKCGLAGSQEMDEFLCDQFVTTLASDILNKLIEAFFEKDADLKAKMLAERKQPTIQGLENLAKQVKGDFVLGDQMSYADLALFDAEQWLARTVGVELPSKLKAIVIKVEADPKIAAYIASRPATPF